jgi:hypothetical protein
VRDLVERARILPKAASCRSVVREIAEERGGINRNRLGWWIKRHEGRFVDNRRIIPDKTAGGQCQSLAHRIGFFGFVGFFQPTTKSARSLAHSVEVEI